MLFLLVTKPNRLTLPILDFLMETENIFFQATFEAISKTNSKASLEMPFDAENSDGTYQPYVLFFLFRDSCIEF